MTLPALSARVSAASMQRRKLNLKAKLESVSCYTSFKRYNQSRSTLGQPEGC